MALQVVLLREDFLKALYVCSLQLVLFTYESVREFPWSLETMRLSAIHFYKVIELIIRADSSLSREMVKHLNKVYILHDSHTLKFFCSECKSSFSCSLKLFPENPVLQVTLLSCEVNLSITSPG